MVIFDNKILVFGLYNGILPNTTCGNIVVMEKIVHLLESLDRALVVIHKNVKRYTKVLVIIKEIWQVRSILPLRMGHSPKSRSSQCAVSLHGAIQALCHLGGRVLSMQCDYRGLPYISKSH